MWRIVLSASALWIAALLTLAGAAVAANEPVAKPAPPHPTTSPATRPASGLAAYFRKNVTVDVTPQFLIIHSDGIPDHTTGDFPNPRNPNRILKQNYTFKIPLNAAPADHITKLPMGPIGVAINGVPFYNPYNAEGADAAKNEAFDDCCGHPDPQGRYHYHIYPKCIHTSFVDKPGEHSPLIGFAFDGYAIYGPNGDGGKPHRPTSTSATAIAIPSAATTTTSQTSSPTSSGDITASWKCRTSMARKGARGADAKAAPGDEAIPADAGPAAWAPLPAAASSDASDRSAPR
jgi:hypothetical protein